MTRAARDVYVGLMSGTSLDGISACVVRFRGSPRTENGPAALGAAAENSGYELLAFEAIAYNTEQRAHLLRAMESGTAQEYCRLAFDLGGWLADAATAVLMEAGVPRDEVRAVGSHGQTLWHEPVHSTWQIGESAVIAERLGIDVVSDFRVRDVAAGGHGAPLVPIADSLLFAARDHWRALQNIGGIGNVTIVPPSALERRSGGAVGPGSEEHSYSSTAPQLYRSIRAFDTGPGVNVIDAVVRLLRPELRFDRDGALARAGNAVDEVVDELLAHPYFAAEPPKSTGRELFTPEYAARLVKRCRELRGNCTDEDAIATATSLSARSIADAYRRFMPEPVEDVLASGGGAKNAALLDMLRTLVAPLRVRSFDEVFFDGEAKEAVAFALLAKLFLDGRPGNVPSATGARGPRILGKLTPAGAVER
ncbi:MAG TPA: anhydro-N-acetylmuramic acid kinase [Gemmatimonadaceae bacterium]|nr:anhydro-N-acetylmuramic acid kinase [Gemmatimonadaceae bacterium]